MKVCLDGHGLSIVKLCWVARIKALLQIVAEVTLSDSDLLQALSVLRALSAKIMSQSATVVHGMHICVGWSPQLVGFA